MHRICVVGTTGSSKTTLAKQLGDTIAGPGIDLDKPYWTLGWKPRTHEDVRRLLAPLIETDRWSGSGSGYGRRDESWA